MKFGLRRVKLSLQLNPSMKRALWFVIVLLAVSCLDDPDCFQLNNNIIGISFKVLGSTRPDTLFLENITIPGASSVFYHKEGAVTVTTAAALPLNFTTDESLIQFNHFGGGSNFIRLGYTTQTQYVSDECGSRFILSDLKTLGHDFDSLRLVDRQPNKVAPNNIEIYRCPDPKYLTVVFRDLYVNNLGNEVRRTGSIKLSEITDNFSGIASYENTERATYYLRLDTTANQTTYTFVQPDGTTNSLAVNYQRTFQKRYNPCDPRTFISGLSVANTDFTLTEMVLDNNGSARSTIPDPPEPNIYIYRCPRTNLVKIDFKQRVPGTSSSLRADTVSLKSVKANYTAQVFYSNVNVTSITVPIDETSPTTDIYLEYENNTETLKLSYTINTPRTLIDECGQQGLYSKLQLAEALTDVRVVADSLRFPSVSNIEIIH